MIQFQTELLLNVQNIILGLAMVAQPARLVTKLSKDKSSTVTSVVKAEQDNTQAHIKFLYAATLISLGTFEDFFN